MKAAAANEDETIIRNCYVERNTDDLSTVWNHFI
jgi:hypothetical protein